MKDMMQRREPIQHCGATARGLSARRRTLEVDMKAIIEASGKGSIFRTVAGQVVGARKRRTPDFHLGFESARSLFAELTPARLDLLDTLLKVGPRSSLDVAPCIDTSRLH